MRNGDWLTADDQAPVDLVISSMVLEHLDDEHVARYFDFAAQQLRPGGRGILFAPGSPPHWGIEDEIAGHYRRYTARSLSDAITRHGWTPTHAVGLTYPLSNLLLGLSNTLVERAEADKQALSLQQRTEQSGDRDVEWKTDFPTWTRLLLNETMLRPAHWLQKLRYSRTSKDALVIYCECYPPAGR